MENDYYQYKEEEPNDSFQDPGGEEEAWVYHTIMDIGSIITNYGAEFFVQKLDMKAFELLSTWFYIDSQPKKDVCKLLTKD